MKKYNVSITLIVSEYYNIDAVDEEEARIIGLDNLHDYIKNMRYGEISNECSIDIEEVVR